MTHHRQSQAKSFPQAIYNTFSTLLAVFTVAFLGLAQSADAAVPCSVVSTGTEPSWVTLKPLGDEATLELEVLLPTGPFEVCEFSEDWIGVRLDDIEPPPAGMTAIDVGELRVVGREELDEGTLIRYHVTVTSVGDSAIARLQMTYNPPGERFDLDHSVLIENVAERAGICPLIMQGFDPANVLLDAEETTEMVLDAKVYGNGAGCEFTPEMISFDVHTPELEEPAIAIAVGTAWASPPVGDAQTWHVPLEVTAIGELGSGMVRAIYQPDSPDMASKLQRRDHAAATVAMLSPRAMVVANHKLVAAEQVPTGESLWETPVWITLDLDEAELELLTSGEKEILVIPAALDAPGLVAQIREWRQAGKATLIDVEVLALPAARAFTRYRAHLMGEPYTIPIAPGELEEEGAAEGAFQTKSGENKGPCKLTTGDGQVTIELFKVTTTGLEVFPQALVDMDGEELRSLEVTANFDLDYRLDGPSVTYDRASSATLTCAYKLKEIPLPPPIFSGPFTFYPEIVPTVGGEVTIGVDSFDLVMNTFTFTFKLHHEYGFRWEADSEEIIKIFKPNPPEINFDWNPTFDFKDQVGDLFVKFGPFANFNLGMGSTVALGELGDVRLIDFRGILETEIRRPYSSFVVTPPDLDYASPSWSIKGILQATAQPSIEWSDYMHWMGASDWQVPFDPITLTKTEWPIGASPTITVSEVGSGPYSIGAPVPIKVAMSGFESMLDHVLYNNREVQLYTRPKGGNDPWQLAGEATATGIYDGKRTEVSAQIDAGPELVSGGQWELIATTRGPLFDTLQSKPLTITMVAPFESRYLPFSIEVQAGPGDVVTRHVSFLNFDSEVLAVDNLMSDVSQAQPQMTSGQVDPGGVLEIPVDFTCDAIGEHVGSMVFDWGLVGGETYIGWVNLTLSCQNYHVSPKVLRYELGVGASSMKPFSIYNHTQNTLSFNLDLVTDTVLDQINPASTIDVTFDTPGQVEVTVSCNKPGLRTGQVDVSTGSDPAVSVMTIVNCKRGGGGGGNGGGGEGGSAGDPHFLTFDGKKYNFQGRGEYVLARYDGGGIDFEVQSRQAKVNPLSTKNVTLNQAVALLVGDGAGLADEVSLHSAADQDLQIWVNDVDDTQLVIDGGAPYMLPGGGSIERQGDTYWVAWPALGGEISWVVIYDHHSFLNLQIFPASAMAGGLVGLLGDFDGERGDEPFYNDLSPVDLDQSHYCFDPACFAYGDDGWRVIAANSGSVSHFHYAPGESELTFTPAPGDPIPADEPSIDDFPAGQVEWATEICMASGALEILEDCILDVLVSGDPEMGLANTELWVPMSEWHEVSPSPITESVFGNGPILSIYGDVLALIGEDNGDSVLRIYEQVSGLWTLVETFTSTASSYGQAVAAGDDLIVVTAPGNSEGGEESSIFLYRRNSAGQWSLDSQFFDPELEPDDQFGKSVAISGSWVVVGAPGDREGCDQGDSSCTGVGAVWVMDRSDDTWEKILPAGASSDFAGIAFGWAVAVTGDRLYAGAPNYWEGATYEEGGIFVHRFDGTAWNDEITLIEDTTAGDGSLGHALAVEGSLLVAGDPGRRMAALYTRDPDGTWNAPVVLADDDENDANFGHSVAVSEGRVLIGIGDVGDHTEGLMLFEYRSADDAWGDATIVLDPATPSNLSTAVALGGDQAIVALWGSVLVFEKL